jgi:hypothetical protein
MTDAEHERCRRIAEALDRGDQAPWLRAEPRLTAGERGLIWDLRREQVERARRGHKKTLLRNGSKVSQDAVAIHDLDFWNDDPAPDDDDDRGDDDDTDVPCPRCGGNGVDRTGLRCVQCLGRGRVRRAQEDDDQDEEDQEEAKYAYYEDVEE